MTNQTEQGADPTISTTSPTHIYLDLGELDADKPGVSFRDLREVTWSEDNATGHGIRYIRADLAVSTPEGYTSDVIGKSLNAKAADLLRPFLKPGDKVIWRDSFRWKDDDGVLSNHYDSMELESLAADFGYEVDWDTNFKHAAIIRPAPAKGAP